MAHIAITDTAEEIRLPAGWEENPGDLLQIQAGRAYIIDQLGIESTPAHRFTSLRSEMGGDTADYDLFEDGSLWFSNNAQDEVWSDYRDFINEQLVPGILAAGLTWDSDDTADGTPINQMDRELILHYCNGDQEDARKAVSC